MKPTTAGTHAILPIALDSFIAGMSSDHTDAATITPEAKPRRMLRVRAANLSLRNSTDAEPIIVPTKGINNRGKISLQTINSSLSVLQIYRLLVVKLSKTNFFFVNL